MRSHVPVASTIPPWGAGGLKLSIYPYQEPAARAASRFQGGFHMQSTTRRSVLAGAAAFGGALTLLSSTTQAVDTVFIPNSPAAGYFFGGKLEVSGFAGRMSL